MAYTILPTENFLPTVTPVIESSFKEGEQVLSSNKDIRVVAQYTEDSFVIEKMGGSTGHAEDDQTMTVQIHTGTDGWEKALRATVIHEYNHVIWHQIHGKVDSITIGDLIAMEGLAQHFEEELTGKKPAWADAISEEEAKDVWDKVKDHLGEGALRWWARLSFEEEEFSLWSGYTLAYLIIQKHREGQNQAWPELMKLKTEELVDF